MKIKIGARASKQVERERKWWRANRLYRDRFDIEYESALYLLREMPQTGTPCPTERRPKLLRMLLPKTGNHIYYAIERNVVVILALWGASHEHPPKL